MAQFRIAGPARADLAAILGASESRWGDAAKERYAELLAAAMRSIAADPHGPLTRDRGHVVPRIRSFHVRHAKRGHAVKAPVHVIYFRVDRHGAIEIVRVLHERMEPTLHVTTRRAGGRRSGSRR